MFSKIKKYEEITDRVEVEIADYLAKVARMQMSKEATRSVRSMLNITTDLERIGDIYFQISRTLSKKDDEKIYFTPEQRQGVNKMLDQVQSAFDVMNDNLKAHYPDVTIDAALSAEKKINVLRNDLRAAHLSKIGDELNLENMLTYSNIFSSLEKVGDHIINVSEAVSEVNIS